MIEIDRLTKHYKQGKTVVRALDEVSFNIESGEFVAIEGRSGSGKSTLLHILGALDAPDEGTIEYNGQDLARLSSGQRSRVRNTQFGFVFQFGQLVPELTAVDNVALPLLLNRSRRKPAYALAESWLERLGLGDVAVAVHPDAERYHHFIGRRVVLPIIGIEIPVIAEKIRLSRPFSVVSVFTSRLPRERIRCPRRRSPRRPQSTHRCHQRPLTRRIALVVEPLLPGRRTYR